MIDLSATTCPTTITAQDETFFPALFQPAGRKVFYWSEKFRSEEAAFASAYLRLKAAHDAANEVAKGWNLEVFDPEASPGFRP